MSFTRMSLHESILRALQAQGFAEPTPIQAQAIPPALDGRDVLGVAQTGTGKTAAFLVPSVQSLLSRAKLAKGGAPRMVVLAPTRELALQITEDARATLRFTDLRVAAVYGGAPIRQQADQLRKGVDLVVATPGRLLDHVQRRNIRFSDVEILVLDEADRMLDMGFLPDIDSIVRRMPDRRQTMLFSATMPAAIESLAARFLRHPVRVEIENSRPPAAIRQQLYPVPKHLKVGLLVELLRRAEVTRGLIFTRTKQDADVVCRQLRTAGLRVAEMHGDFSQKDRVEALERFRQGKVRLLVATNVAARGLDIEGISHVVNFDVPEEAENYVHRIGRTARVDADGVAWTLVTPDDEGQLAAIEYLLGETIERATLVGFDYSVPAPDWAKPSRAALRKMITGDGGAFSRWKSLTR